MHHDLRSIPLCIQHHIQLTSLSFQVSQPSHSWVTAISIFLPWKSKVKVMGEVKVWSHNVSLTFYQLTSLSFHVNQPSHSWDTTFSKFDLENPRSRSWKRWTLKVKTWVQHFIDSHPFHSMSIGHPIPEIGLFQNLTWKSKVKVMVVVKVESHKVGVTSYRLTSLSFHVNLPSHSWDTAFFKIWPWKSKVKVMGEVDIESHNMGPTFYRLTSLSFHVNRLSDSRDTAFSKFDLENPRSRSWVRERWKSQNGCNILSTHMPFVPCQSALPFLRYNIFKIWPWKSKVKVKWPWCCTTTGLDNSIEPQMV